MPGDNLQDMQELLAAQNRQPKKPAKKFVYKKKKGKGEGFLASGFKTANPD